jgi:hypothetical protein
MQLGRRGSVQSALPLHSAQPSAVHATPAGQSALVVQGRQAFVPESQDAHEPVHGAFVAVAQPRHRPATHRSPAVRQSAWTWQVPAGSRWQAALTQLEPAGHGEKAQESDATHVCVTGLQSWVPGQSARVVQLPAPPLTHWLVAQVHPLGQSEGERQ